MWKLALLTASLVACTSSPGSVNGTIEGRSLAATDAIAVPGPEGSMQIVIGSQGNLCLPGESLNRPGDSMLILTVQDNSYHKLPEAPTTYEYQQEDTSKPRIAGIEAGILDERCQNAAQFATPKAAHLTLHDIGEGAFVGDFDITFINGDHVDGSIQPSKCSHFKPLRCGAFLADETAN
jgi:hypothetical protein